MRSKIIRGISSVKYMALRWQVFERDKFTCQYCGRAAPDVVLEMDHKLPFSSGGTNDLDNLITACYTCNRGRGEIQRAMVQAMRRQHAETREFLWTRICQELSIGPLTSKEIATKLGERVESVRPYLSRRRGKEVIRQRDGTWRLP